MPALKKSAQLLPKWQASLLVTLLTAFLSGHCFAEKSLRILYYQSPSDAPEETFIYSGETLLSNLEIPRFNFSHTIEGPSGSLRLRFLPRALAEGEEFPKDAPFVNIPESWSKSLLLVFPNKENKVMPIKVQAINASDNIFGPGKIYFMNFSQVQIGGTLGDRKVNIKPKKFSIIESPIASNGFYPAKLFSIIKPGDKPQRFVKQMWKHNNKERQLVFIFPQPAPVHATYYCAPIKDF